MSPLINNETKQKRKVITVVHTLFGRCKDIYVFGSYRKLYDFLTEKSGISLTTYKRKQTNKRLAASELVKADLPNDQQLIIKESRL